MHSAGKTRRLTAVTSTHAPALQLVEAKVTGNSARGLSLNRTHPGTATNVDTELLAAVSIRCQHISKKASVTEMQRAQSAAQATHSQTHTYSCCQPPLLAAQILAAPANSKAVRCVLQRPARITQAHTQKRKKTHMHTQTCVTPGGNPSGR